jgi:hypothetical protein
LNASAVLESLRRTLGADPPAAFIAELVQRLQQLTANVVDGQVLAAPDATELRAGILELVRVEALPRLARVNPGDALRTLDKLRAYGLVNLENERAPLLAELAARFPPPPAPDWPELTALRRLAETQPELCRLRPPASHVGFAHELGRRGLPLPDEVLALYAAMDGFDLTARAAPTLPVLALVPSESIDERDPDEGLPARTALFQGGDAEQLCVYRDRQGAEERWQANGGRGADGGNAADGGGRGRWMVVFEYDYEPVARRPLDVRALLRFGMARVEAPVEALEGELGWDRFLGVDR